jgi:amino-acid N-acetyltransferase
MTIAVLGADELPEAIALLDATGLPSADLETSRVRLLGVRDSQGLEGIIGIEELGEVALLRSLAVRHDRRQSGLGSSLVAELERSAAEAGVRVVYLLTTTAEGFFVRRGYARVAREAVPAMVRATREFSALCPSSSAVMRKPLETEAPREPR